KKLLAESMLDVARLREALGKTSDAQFPEDGRDLGDRREGLLAAACLRAHRGRAEDLPLHLLARRRCGITRPAAYARRRATPVWLPTSAYSAAARAAGSISRWHPFRPRGVLLAVAALMLTRAPEPVARRGLICGHRS